MSIAISLGTALYHVGIRLAAPFVPKARKWVDGRKGLWQRLEKKSEVLKGCVWMHCASVGEFEQGRPVLEAIKRERPELPILLTFFSPSGYEARKDFPLATHVEYLPPDSRANAERLLRTIKPKAAVFVKYEFWQQHLAALQRSSVPSFLVSAIFRPSQPFFRWYGGGHRAMLRTFNRLLVQDEASLDLLKTIDIPNVTVSGDTRFDRVATIATQDETLAIASRFRESRYANDHDRGLPILVCGSTWAADEEIIATALRGSADQQRIMLVPHEIGPDRIHEMRARFKHLNGDSVSYQQALWSACTPDEENAGPDGHNWKDARVLIIDTMGLLSRLYKYADVTYVGGGFGTGIHNTLEPAAWGKPVIFGPNHQRFAEAQGLIDAGAGFAVRNADELRSVLKHLILDAGALRTASEAASRYVSERRGATARVMAVVLASI